MMAEDLNLGWCFRAQTLYWATWLNGWGGEGKNPLRGLLIRSDFRTMHSSGDYLGLALAHLSPVRSSGDLIWRWAPSCEHRAQWPGHALLVAPSLPVTSSCHPAIQLGRAHPCTRTAGFSTFRLTQAERACIAARRPPCLLCKASHHVGGAILGALAHSTLLSAQNLPLLHPQLAYHGDRTDTIINTSLWLKTMSSNQRQNAQW